MTVFLSDFYMQTDLPLNRPTTLVLLTCVFSEKMLNREEMLDTWQE